MDIEGAPRRFPSSAAHSSRAARVEPCELRGVFDVKERTMAKLSESDRDKLPASKFAEPKKRAYPIEDAAHARNAKARASQAVKAGRMSEAEESKIDKKADAVIKKD
jgi:hypothetical protein